VVHGWWKDTGQVQDMLDANRLILDDIEERHEGEERDSRVEGRVCVAEGAVVEGSTIRGPAIIGRGARVTDSYVGPYTAIGEDVVIQSSEIEHSIVLAGSAIRDLPGRVEASLIGRGVSITRTEALPRVFRFVVGDGSDITIL
jgi:glucose-1-phosphate thymidylyltransferase